jgi:hypothetical protein
LQLEFFILKPCDQHLDERHGVFGFRCRAEGEFVLAMSLIFRRLIAKGSLDGFPKLEFGPSPGAFEIGESFPSEVFNLRQNGLQLLNALGQVVDGGGFRPRSF